MSQRAITADPKRVPYLDTRDRCDSCGSQAYVYVILHESERLPDSGELYFCRHHARKYWHVLQPFVSFLLDESSRLFEEIKDDKHWVEGQAAHIPVRPKQPPKQP